MARLPPRQRIWLIPLVLINVIAVVLSASRIGMILLVITIAYFLLRSRHRFLYLIILAAAMAIFALSVPPRYWTRFVSLRQLGDIVVDRSLLLRMHTFEVGWKIFLEHFWTGVGVGNYAAWSQRYMSIAIFAHNSFLDVAATLGIFGFTVYIFWLGSAYGMILAAIKRSTQMGAHLLRSVSLDLACVVGMFLLAAATLDLAYSPFLWLLFGCVNALRTCAVSSGPENAPPLARTSTP